MDFNRQKLVHLDYGLVTRKTFAFDVGTVFIKSTLIHKLITLSKQKKSYGQTLS